jgi:hypothetical protein
MPQTDYHYSITNDFTSLPPGGTPNLEALEAQISADAAIDQALVSTAIHLDDVTITFVDALSPTGKSALDAVVAAHTGVALVDTPQRVNSLAEQTNPNQAPDVALQLQLTAVKGGNWQLTWYCEISVAAVVSNSGVAARVMVDGVERAYSSSRDDQYQSFSGSGLLVYNDGETPDIQIEFARIGVANTARIRRLQIALVPED